VNTLPSLKAFQLAMIFNRFVIDGDTYPTDAEYINDEDGERIVVSNDSDELTFIKIVSKDDSNVFVVSNGSDDYTVQFLSSQAINPFSE
jgi:hypothetical protein